MSGSPRRILWITDRYPPLPGGMSVSCARHVRGLRHRGHTVDVLHLGAPGAASTDIDTVVRDNGTDILVPADPDPALAANHAWLVIEQRHRRAPYDAICGFGASTAGFHAVTYGEWLGGLHTAVLVRGNDFDRDWFLPQRGMFVREAFARAHAIGAVTQEKVRRISASFPKKRVIYTPNSIDLARWQLLAADRAKRDDIRRLLGAGAGVRVIGLFGELKAKKRIPFWLEAVRDRDLLPHLRLLIVGTLDDATTALLDDPAVAPRSLRLPFCNPAELPGLYAACDFVAIPSLFEGMPNVLLEAMACGCVPIVSHAGAMADIVTDGVNGFSFDPVDRNAAGDATVRALSLSPDEWQSMSERAQSHIATEFSPARELDILEAVLTPDAP